jgi:hypothetical protein
MEDGNIIPVSKFKVSVKWLKPRYGEIVYGSLTIKCDDVYLTRGVDKEGKYKNSIRLDIYQLMKWYRYSRYFIKYQPYHKVKFIDEKSEDEDYDDFADESYYSISGHLLDGAVPGMVLPPLQFWKIDDMIGIE